MSKSSTGYLFECYIWLVNTISRGPISRKAIDEKWAHASVNDYQTDAIPDSTFHRWRNTVELLFDITIKCNASGEYYIDGVTDLHRTDLRGRILNLLSVNNMLRDCHENLRKQILFEPIPAGEEHLETIIAAMRDRQVLELSYQNFVSDKPTVYHVEAYCLKAYRQRWYLIAFAQERNGIRHFSLDRMVQIQPTQDNYTIPDDFDAEEYFSQVCGVTIPKMQPQEIKIKVSKAIVPYFRTLPIHPSQKEIEVRENDSVFSYYLIPNEEFFRELRAWGVGVLVLSPDRIARDFCAEAKLIYRLYQSSPE